MHLFLPVSRGFLGYKIILFIKIKCLVVEIKLKIMRKTLSVCFKENYLFICKTQKDFSIFQNSTDMFGKRRINLGEQIFNHSCHTFVTQAYANSISAL